MKDWAIFINEYDKNSILVVGYKPNLLETQKAIVKDGYTKRLYVSVIQQHLFKHINMRRATMSKTIYRKLKDYIQKTDSGSTLIFGNLMSDNCVYNFENPNKQGEYIDWRGQGVYGYEMDFLLEYYVVGIFPAYRIEKNTIKPYLHIALKKEKPEL